MGGHKLAMKMISVAALGLGLQLAVGSAAFAATDATGMMNGVTHGAGMGKARCSPGDPNVMVDQKTKTYVLDKAAMKSTSKGAAAPGAMAAGADATGMAKMVSMCRSEAMSMGAKMSGGGMMKMGSAKSK